MTPRLDVGTRIGPYAITAPLGAGGMGEVWRAFDSRLGREVAVKALPDSVASDVERLARLEREARLLASLSHPNIATIYGLEIAAGAPVLILELIEGDTLADRLAHRPLSVPDAIATALQIADALDAAHEKHVIHCDLKPANIKITSDGTVKVLDFGLAKPAGPVLPADVSQLPTLTIVSTEQGVIRGTPSYMAPEQARGLAVDKRIDIWAFGCVLYEMLTGERAFHGATASDIMASVLTAEPDSRRLQHIDARLREVLTRCLEKDPRKRWRDIGDVRSELAAIRDARPAAPIASEHANRMSRGLWIAGIVAAVLVGAIVGYVAHRDSQPPGPPTTDTSVGTFDFSLPSATALYPGTWMVPFAASPDGRWLAFTATTGGRPSRLWLRDKTEGGLHEIAGSDGAVSPFWSPDSKAVGYLASSGIYLVDVPGGAPKSLLRLTNARGASWGPGDLILAWVQGKGIQAISATKGTTRQLTTPSDSDSNHRWPQFAGGRRFLYLATSQRPTIYLASLDDGGARERIMELPSPASSIQYVSGYLFYVEQGVLWAQRLDQNTLRPSGDRQRIVAGVPVGGPGTAPYSVSEHGPLVYWTQSLIQPAAQLQWMTRTGAVAGRVGSVAVYDGFDLSPDDSRIAAAQVGATGTDIWITDLPDGSRFRAAFNTASSNDTAPIWAGDNATLTYLSTGTRGLALKRADLVGNIAPTELVSSPRNQLADSWNKSRDELIFEGYGSGGDGDLFVLHTRDGHVERLVINSGANDRAGRLSPDDRWIAYMTDESGQDEIWVAAYPSGQPRRRVSQGGGSHPEWNSAGSEVFYISASGDLTAVTFRGARESGIVTERPLRLFAMPGPVDYVAGGHNMFQSARDGKRFLVAAKSQSGDAPPLRFIVNWRSLLSGN